MSNEKIKNIYSDEVKLALLEQSINSINQTLIRFESRFDRLDLKLEKMSDKIDSHFKWTVGLIFGLYATALGTMIGAVGKAYHWF
jgi:uncharacterized coiled-coil protein SlyX